MQQVKYKSSGIIIDHEKGLLFCVGEEMAVTGEKFLLTPGGTVSTVDVEDYNDVEVLKSNKPDKATMDEKLSDELNEELSLTPNMYESELAFTSQALAATNPNIKLVMDSYKMILNSNAVIKPNYIRNDEDHDVYEAVWVKWEDLIQTESGYDLKPGTMLKVIYVDKETGKRGKEIRLASEYLLTAISKESVIPKLIELKLFKQPVN